jgi:osmotically-inducible protein OsmY
MNKRFAALISGFALAAFCAGCSETANTNVSNSSNTGTVVNNNGNKNTSGVTTLNSNANANATGHSTYNANISKEEYEKDKARYGKEAEGLGDKIGKGLSDGYYWVKVKGALALVSDLRDSTINVDIENGVVTLRGTVANKDQVDKALKAAKVDGVTKVVNQLKVAADGDKGTGNKNANTGAAKKG